MIHDTRGQIWQRKVGFIIILLSLCSFFSSSTIHNPSTSPTTTHILAFPMSASTSHQPKQCISSITHPRAIHPLLYQTPLTSLQTQKHQFNTYQSNKPHTGKTFFTTIQFEPCTLGNTCFTIDDGGELTLDWCNDPGDASAFQHVS